MSTIAIAVILVVRLLVPLGLLVALGEWNCRREARYWLSR